jgi:hypothetical protein
VPVAYPLFTFLSLPPSIICNSADTNSAESLVVDIKSKTTKAILAAAVGNHRHLNSKASITDIDAKEENDRQETC